MEDSLEMLGGGVYCGGGRKGRGWNQTLTLAVFTCTQQTEAVQVLTGTQSHSFMLWCKMPQQNKQDSRQTFIWNFLLHDEQLRSALNELCCFLSSKCAAVFTSQTSPRQKVSSRYQCHKNYMIPKSIPR